MQDSMNEGKKAFLETFQYELIFSDYSVIRNFHKSLLVHLEKLLEEDKNSKQPTLTLGQIFLKFVKYKINIGSFF
jgi:hypothetical protein